MEQVRDKTGKAWEPRVGDTVRTVRFSRKRYVYVITQVNPDGSLSLENEHATNTMYPNEVAHVGRSEEAKRRDAEEWARRCITDEEHAGFAQELRMARALLGAACLQVWRAAKGGPGKSTPLGRAEGELSELRSAMEQLVKRQPGETMDAWPDAAHLLYFPHEPWPMPTLRPWMLERQGIEFKYHHKPGFTAEQAQALREDVEGVQALVARVRARCEVAPLPRGWPGLKCADEVTKYLSRFLQRDL